MIYFIVALGSMIIGILLGWSVRESRKKTMGTLRVDQSDPDEPPYLFLELHEVDPYDIMKLKEVVFDVKVENFVSQK